MKTLFTSSTVSHLQSLLNRTLRLRSTHSSLYNALSDKNNSRTFGTLQKISNEICLAWHFLLFNSHSTTSRNDLSNFKEIVLAVICPLFLIINLQSSIDKVISGDCAISTPSHFLSQYFKSKILKKNCLHTISPLPHQHRSTRLHQRNGGRIDLFEQFLAAGEGDFNFQRDFA